MQKENKILHNKCPYCEHEWIPRVEDPKECPRCHRRFDYPKKVL